MKPGPHICRIAFGSGHSPDRFPANAGVARSCAITIILCACFFALTAPISATENTDQAGSRKDRCVGQMDRIDQQIEKITIITDELSRLTPRNPHEADRISRFVQTSRNQLEFFRNRIDRAKNQDERISGQLQQNQSTLCPPCISSDVNLLCRQIESLTGDVSDYMVRANEFLSSVKSADIVSDRLAQIEKTIRRLEAANLTNDSVIVDAKKSIDRARTCLRNRQTDEAMDASLEAERLVTRAQARVAPPQSGNGPFTELKDLAAKTQRIIDSTGNAKAKTVLEKGAAHLATAEQLASEGKAKEAQSELAIARILITKAHQLSRP